MFNLEKWIDLIWIHKVEGKFLQLQLSVLADASDVGDAQGSFEKKWTLVAFSRSANPHE